MSSLYQKYVARRHRRKKESEACDAGVRSAEDQTAAAGAGAAPATRASDPRVVQIPIDEIVRVYGNIRGLIVDENGLDVIYWRRLNGEQSDDEGGNKTTKKKKLPEGFGGGASYYHGGGDDDEDGDDEEEEEDNDKGLILYKESRRRSKRITLTQGDFSSSSSSSFSSPPTLSSSKGQAHRDFQQDSVNPSKPTIPSSIGIQTSASIEKPYPKSQLPDPPLPLPPQCHPLQLQGTTPAVPAPAAREPPLPPPAPRNDPPLPPPPPSPVVKIPAPAPAPAPAPPPPPLAKKVPNPKLPTQPKLLALQESVSMANQVKMKPLHWDKVNAEVDHSMVWHKIDRGSFSFDGDLMEALFGYVATNRKPTDGRRPGEPNSGAGNPVGPSASLIYILDPRKSQNTAIVLKSLGVAPEEILDALLDGHDVDPETLEKLARVSPTQEEQTEILEFSGDESRLADAETSLRHVLKQVPYAFKRLSAMRIRSNFSPEIIQHKESLKTLELACKELRAQGLFMKLLEAILKAGNRMNAGTARGNAQAFNLMALRKLSDVKSVDGKTTLLHFVVQEVVRSEGKRYVMRKKSNEGLADVDEDPAPGVSKDEREMEYVKCGLPVVAGLSAEFSNVKKSASIDHATFTATCSTLAAHLREARRVLSGDSEENGGYPAKMRAFLDSAEEELKGLREEEGRVMEFVKRTTAYYEAGAFKDKNQFQLFAIIKDFLGMVDRVCAELAKDAQRKKITTVNTSSNPNPGPNSAPASRHAVRFPILPPNFMSEMSRQSSSSDSDDEG